MKQFIQNLRAGKILAHIVLKIKASFHVEFYQMESAGSVK